MKSLAQRRTINVCLTALSAAVVVALYIVGRGTLRSTGFASGWLLFGMIGILALYNVRKAVPFLPLGSSAAWLQFHIYVAFLSFAVFVVHVQFWLPNGVFECLLALTYVIVFLSGLIGLYITRTYPRRLTDLGNEIIFEHIPVERRQIRDRIESLVLEGNTEAGTSATPEFYRSHIRSFLTAHRDVISHLFRGASARYRSLMRAIEDQNRYLNDDERGVMAEVAALVNRKHQLDAQYALQGALKVWLFVHVPATYVLLIFSVLHSMVVHAWSGGLP